MLFFEATSSCKAAKNTGMQRMTRGLYRHLRDRLEIRPISWNKKGKCYQELGERELKILEDPFGVRSKPSVRPEWYGETRTAEWWRLFFRKKIDLESKLTATDILLVPDFYQDSRTDLLPQIIRKTGVYSLAIFHDAAALRLPYVSDKDRRRFRNYLKSLAAFNLVICISHESRADLLRRWSDDGIVPAKTVVEPWPIQFNDSARESGTNGTEPIVACIATFEPRKNHFTLLRAAEKLWARGIHFQLQLVGRTTHYSGPRMIPALWQLQRRGRPVQWLRHINDDALHQVYRSCRFTVYPSLMEGFGLPIAESLWHGKPVVCGGNGALGEIARDGGCLLVDQTNEDDLSSAIEKLLRDDQLYARLREEARNRTFRSWSDYTEDLLGYLQRPET